MNIKQFSKEHLSSVLGALIRVKNGEIDDYGLGICWNADCLTDIVYDAYEVVAEVSSEWALHSGKEGYPIEESYDDNLWAGCQGDIHYELLDFLIDELTKAVDSYDE